MSLPLFTLQELHHGMELEASNGRRVRAVTVFAHALRFFMETCLSELSDMAISDQAITSADVQWVITVPAIWRQSAKQFMRHAAIEVLYIISTQFPTCIHIYIVIIYHYCI